MGSLESSAGAPTGPAAVTAIVVTYNSEGYVAALLDSLPAAFGELTHHTVVVDNGSSDGTVAAVSGYGCTVVTQENLGFAAGVNTGAALAHPGSHLLILNPDATLASEAVPALMAALERPTVGIVAPLIFNADGRVFPSLRREPTLGRVGGLTFTGHPAVSELVTDAAAYRYAHAADWATGAVLLVRRACFGELGGFDESYFLYSEETDFCLRARDQGWLTWFTPSAHAMHVGGGSGESATTHTIQVLNRIRLYRRRKGDARAWIYLVLVLLREVRLAVTGDRRAVTAARAILRRSSRPAQAEWGRGWLPT